MSLYATLLSREVDNKMGDSTLQFKCPSQLLPDGYCSPTCSKAGACGNLYGELLLKPRAYFNYFTLLAPLSPADLLAGSGGTRAGGVAAAAALEHASAAEAGTSSALLLEATAVAAFATLTRGAIGAWAAITAGAVTTGTILAVASEGARSGTGLLGSNVGLGNDVLTKNTVDGGEVLLEVSNAFVGEGIVAPAPVVLLLDELARQQRLHEPHDVKVGHIGQGAVSRAVDVVLNGNNTLWRGLLARMTSKAHAREGRGGGAP